MKKPTSSPDPQEKFSVGQYNFTRYLLSKVSVDDRALNRYCFQILQQAFASRHSIQPPRILEIGCGIGTMIQRLVSWGLFNQGEYTAIDIQEENIQMALQRLHAWAADSGFQVEQLREGLLVLQRENQNARIQLEAIDLFDFIRRERDKQTWHLILAHAFLDLVDVSSTLPSLFSLLEEGGLFYFTLNFDGNTIFEPLIFPEVEQQILAHYHHSMDTRRVGGKPSGDSRAGRHLFSQIEAAGGEILAAGSSDWVVYPQKGRYPLDEGYFLHHIIHTIQTELQLHAPTTISELDQWAQARHQQINEGTLVYVAHQMDFVGQVPARALHG